MLTALQTGLVEPSCGSDLAAAIDQLDLVTDDLVLLSSRRFEAVLPNLLLAGFQERLDPILKGFDLRLAVKSPSLDGKQGRLLNLSERQHQGLMRIQVLLVQRILEVTRKHLLNRVSGGIKTMQRDHIRIAFGRAVEAMELIKANSDRAGIAQEYQFQQELIRQVVAEPLKMMGGHGYLLTGSAPLGYLLAILQSLVVAPEMSCQRGAE